MSDEIDFQPEAEAEIDFIPEEASAPAGDGIDFEPEAAAAPAPKTTRTPLERATRKARLLQEMGDTRAEGARLDSRITTIDNASAFVRGFTPSGAMESPVMAARAIYEDISANSRPLQDFYDQYSEWAARSRSKAKPLTEKERLWWKDLAELHDDIRTATALADNMKALRPRQEVYRKISADAARLLREGKAKGLVK